MGADWFTLNTYFGIVATNIPPLVQESPPRDRKWKKSEIGEFYISLLKEKYNLPDGCKFHSITNELHSRLEYVGPESLEDYMEIVLGYEITKDNRESFTPEVLIQKREDIQHFLNDNLNLTKYFNNFPFLVGGHKWILYDESDFD